MVVTIVKVVTLPVESIKCPVAVGTNTGMRSKIIGGSTSPTIHRELVLDAVLKAVRRRRPKSTLIHSDQGTQYGRDAPKRFCKAN